MFKMRNVSMQHSDQQLVKNNVSSTELYKIDLNVTLDLLTAMTNELVTDYHRFNIKHVDIDEKSRSK